MTPSDDQPPTVNRGRLARLPLIGRVVASPAFASADFRRLWMAAAFNQVGMNGEQLMLGLLVFQITDSTAWVGATLALYALPNLVFGILSGAIADWLDRRTLLRILDFTTAVSMALFAGMLALGFDTLWVILAFTLIGGSLRALYAPARMSYAYDIVGGAHVVAGLGLLNLGTRVGQLVGAVAAGVVMQYLGAPIAFLLLAASHLVALAWLMQLRSAGDSAPTERVPIGQNLREFFVELRHNRSLLTLVVVTAVVEVFGFSFSTVLPELATNRFDVGAEGLGLMHSARAVGGVLASLALAGMTGFERRGLAFLGVLYAFGASLILLSAAGQFVLALLALLLVAVLATSSDVLTQSMMQLSVPNKLRGRAMGSWILAVGASPLGHLQMGALAVSFGVGGALLVNGGALIGVAILATVAAPRLRRL
jgi:predicted MFS family arabinose efflux permease